MLPSTNSHRQACLGLVDLVLGLSNVTYLKVKKIILCCQYDRYLNKTNTIDLTILPAIEQNSFHISSVITTKITLYGHAILFSS